MRTDDRRIVDAALAGELDGFRTTRVTLELPTSVVDGLQEIARLESEAREGEPVDWRALAASALADRFKSETFIGLPVGKQSPVDQQREELHEAWRTARGAPWGIESGDRASFRLYRRFARRVAHVATLLGMSNYGRRVTREAEEELAHAAEDRARHGG